VRFGVGSKLSTILGEDIAVAEMLKEQSESGRRIHILRYPSMIGVSGLELGTAE
jgi:hypothetical protein